MLPKVYPITDRTLSGLSHAEQVARLIDGGATLIQLREKHLPAIDFFREADTACKVAARNGVKIIINDRVDVAMAVGAGGIHLGQDDLPTEAARRLMKADSIIGFSTHTLQQLETATRLPIDYIAFGPVFATTTKTDPEPTVGVQLLRAAKELVNNLPLVAIGGITARNVQAALKSGADSVAIISAAVAEPSKISQNMRELLALAVD